MGQKSTQEAVVRYYSRLGSRLGYNLVMRGSKHFGYYDKTHKTERAAQVRFLEKFADLLELKPGMELLDAGCGQGVVACYLAAKYDVRVTGLTLVPFEVKASEKRARNARVADKTEFIIGDYANTLGPSKTFDRIYTVETLSHAPDVERVLRNFYKLLKPGGKIVCIEYECNYDKLSPDQASMIEFAVRYGALHGAKQFGPGEFMQTIRSVGFHDATEYDWTTACLPSFQRIRRLAKPLRNLVDKARLRRYFINTTIARYYADLAEQKKFRFKAYTATKPSKKS
jgi:sterol 24-C-methyltransferase